MPYVFDTTTAVSAVGEGRYAASLDAGWVVGGGVNGGYLLAVIGNALRATLPSKPDPLSVCAWFRLEDGREPDPISLLLVVDALPPVTFTHGNLGWAPTLELTAHVRAKPAAGWLKVRHATRNMAGGMFEEDCEVWDSAGRLVAQSRQLARLPRQG